LGIEVLSIALYILCYVLLEKFKSNEAGLLYGIFCIRNYTFGICLIYGAMGSFDVIEISELSQSAELSVWFPQVLY
jgi:NADH-quinone oxidoreductase subunit N